MQLQRTIGGLSLFFTAIGGMIGSGWLFGPYYAAHVAGPAAIISWVLGGALILIIALTFAELVTMFPVAGSMVRFGEISHGPLVGFIITWISWIAAVCIAPLETLAAIQYSSHFFPWLVKPEGASYNLTATGMLISAGLMLSMCYLNYHGAKFFAKTNSTIVIWKLAIPIFTIVFFISHHFHPQNFYQFNGFAPTGIKNILAALPTAGVMLSFMGYSGAIQLAGETKNPGKTMPRALISAILACTLLYAGLQVAFIGIVDPKLLQNGWQKLSFSGDAGPFAAVAVALGLTWFVKLLYIDAIISPYGTGLTFTGTTARVNYAASENAYFPQIFKKLNSNGVPHIALLTNFFIGMLLFLPFPGWKDMVGFIVTSFVIVYGIGPISLVSLRETMPDHERTFKLPKAGLLAVLAFYICNLMLIWAGWKTVLPLLTIVSIGLCYLMAFSFTKAGKKLDLNLKQTYWLLPHFIGLGLISYLSSFSGGKDLIHFGWDFLVVAIFSYVIFKIATHKKMHKENLIQKI